MRFRSRPKELDAYIGQVKAKQDNIVWPRPLINSRGVDEFFWKGSPNPTPVQRIAALLFAAVFFGGALAFASMAWELGGSGLAWFGTIAVLVFALGLRFFWSGTFKRSRGTEEK